ncbi:hypothetical protein [Rhodoligotrophos ferricapiens]|uniref:hypothetical protein n=1 Tax=Rhodoligotrophos ferricapiens TaxID=3069264 RepID=UPI00315D003B
MSPQDLLNEARALAEQGSSFARFIDLDRKHASEDIFMAWDKLQAAAKCLQELQNRVPEA